MASWALPPAGHQLIAPEGKGTELRIVKSMTKPGLGGVEALAMSIGLARWTRPSPPPSPGLWRAGWPSPARLAAAKRFGGAGWEREAVRTRDLPIDASRLLRSFFEPPVEAVRGAFPNLSSWGLAAR